MTSQFTAILALLNSVLAIFLASDASPSSLSAIATYTALGDSYASGTGAGTQTCWLCSRFSGAYPVQLTKTIGPVRYHSAACGGASTVSVIWDQLGGIEESDLVTLTVGGNEVGFFSILNSCVYEWTPHATCEEEVRKSRILIESSRFVNGYVMMLKLILKRMKPRARLLVTGYAIFFNDNTALCDGMTFSRTNPERYLTRQLRRELNHLVRILNHAIGNAAAEAGVEYVDIDPMFEGHRFCEDGVREPNNSRSDTWFFNLQYDRADVTDSHAVGHAHQQELFSAGFGEGYLDVVKVFHPTKDGHAAIRDAIVDQIANE